MSGLPDFSGSTGGRILFNRNIAAAATRLAEENHFAAAAVAAGVNPLMLQQEMRRRDQGLTSFASVLDGGRLGIGDPINSVELELLARQEEELLHLR